MSIWVNDSYAFRRELTLSSVDGAPVGQYAQFYLADTTKVRRDYGDIVVIYSDQTQATPTVQALGRAVTSTLLQKPPENFTGLIVEFQLSKAMVLGEMNTGDYSIYYGNPDLIDPIINPRYSPNPWPNTVGSNGVGVTYTRPGEHWNNGVSHIAGAFAYFTFWGIKVQMVSQIGPDQGIASIQVDGNVGTDVDLYSASVANAVVYENDSLAPGEHILAVQVTGRKSGGSSDFTINVDDFNYVKFIDTSDLGEEVVSLGLTTSVGGA